MQVRRRTCTGHSCRHRRRHMAIIHTDSLSTALGAEALCRALCSDGIVLLQLPRSVGLDQRLHRCRQAMQAFFELPREQKSGCAAAEGPGCQVGYMINGEDEIFESKIFHDPRWPWPSGTVQSAVLGLREVLHTVGLSCLRALANPLGMDPDRLAAYLDQSDDTGTLIGSLAHCSNTSMRVYRYAAGGLGNNIHIDNGFLTVAPAGSSIGLRARRFGGGGGRGRGASEALRPEAHIGSDQLLLFAGDALSFLSGGRMPALVHWVDAPSGDEPRFSFPFFLRPRQDAHLNPASTRRLGHVDTEHEADLAALKPIRQFDLEANQGDVRRSWPWKRPGSRSGEYYSTALYHNDKVGDTTVL